ncbi:MAG: hypothetical protein FWD73_09220 [Polyangiaceae bacterium]|nr:hypothetical protein [Polyangiaceae bacterium]
MAHTAIPVIAADVATPPTLPPRILRALELVYAVEGVVGARIWHWPGRVSVGVRPAMLSAPSELLRRVESAVSGVREPDESWDFGILDID